MQIGASALDIIGKYSGADIFGGGSAESVFAAGAGGATNEQVAAKAIVTAQKREINRIKGYKLDLTAAETQRLAEIQKEIQVIERKAGAGTVRPDELKDRTELYKEADIIIGKPVVDVEADAKLAEYAGLLEALLKPKLNPSLQKRVDYLNRVKDDVEEQFNLNGENETLRRRFQNLTKLVGQLAPPRAVHELSNGEKRVYDDIAELINDHAGVKLQLSARESERVADLEESIINLQASLGADPASQTTAGQVARAYTRF